MRRTETSLTDLLGEEFGPYKLVRRLGVGGMAETFVAVRRGPSGFTQRVCLKLVLPFFRDNEEFIALFEREARLAAKLRHRNIVGVIDFGDIEGTPYMALELVDGADLRCILDAQDRARLPAEYVTLLGIELAEALEHAHNPPLALGIEPASDDDVRGIVHRDISPSNVLVSRQGEILLTDFGVAKAITGTSRKQSAVKGKVPYMSPEQLRAEPLDSRADLFALGVVLFETLGGERPYDGAHDPATIMLILKGEHPPLAQLAPDAPPMLCEVIESLIEPDQEKRPESAAELIEALVDFAPSPRVRRDLGRMVRRVCEETATPSTRPTGSAEAGPQTELLPGAEPEDSEPVAWAESPSRVGTGTRRSQPEPAPEPALEPEPEPEPAAFVEPIPASSGDVAGSKPSTEPVNLVRPPPREAFELRRGSETQDRDAGARKKLWLVLGGALLGIGLVVGGTVALWPSADATEDGPTKTVPSSNKRSEPSTPSTPEPAREPEPEAKAQPEPEPAPEPEPEPEPEPTPPVTPTAAADPEPPKPDPVVANPEPKPAVKKQARLTISVFPWGNIWINGQPWGPAPLKGEALPPGTYRVSVGQKGPTKTKVVRLRAGQRKSINFDLTAE